MEFDHPVLKKLFDFHNNGPKCISVFPHHASVTYIIFLVNQTDSGEFYLQTRQNAANQYKLRDSSTSHCE